MQGKGCLKGAQLRPKTNCLQLRSPSASVRGSLAPEKLSCSPCSAATGTASRWRWQWTASPRFALSLDKTTRGCVYWMGGFLISASKQVTCAVRFRKPEYLKAEKEDASLVGR